MPIHIACKRNIVNSKMPECVPTLFWQKTTIHESLDQSFQVVMLTGCPPWHPYEPTTVELGIKTVRNAHAQSGDVYGLGIAG
jgi:hypothetical protein